MLTAQTGLTPDERARIAAHYRLAAPLIIKSFAGTPFVYGAYPKGFDNAIEWHGAVPQSLPPNVATLDVPTKQGLHRYRCMNAEDLHTLIADEYAVEFHGWGCTTGDPLHARFARILLELDANNSPVPSGHGALVEGALTLCDLLESAGAQSIPMLLGTNGIALWIPLAGEPNYGDVRTWLHAVSNEAAARNPRLFTTEPNSHANARVHLHVSSNAPGRYSALPYSLRGDDELRMCLPIRWDEIEMIRDGEIAAAAFPSRLNSVGDVFFDRVSAIAEGFRIFSAVSIPSAIVLSPEHAKPIESHGRILQAAMAVLADGKPRDAKAILAGALAKNLVPAGTKEKYIYTSLLEYIVRTSGHGHKPAIVQDVDRRFRLNEPQDNWPDLKALAAPPVDAQTQAIIDRLNETVQGADPTAFELAVCDAFAHLGFNATHVGGHQNPDGYADAQLGVLGYRTMIECKTGDGIVHNPDAVEASKYKAPYGAQFCAMVGPAYGEDLELASELQTHGVSAWTADDLQQLLAIGSNPLEMQPLFAPGFVSDSIGDVLWGRLHGPAKRVELICEYLAEGGWAAQRAFAKTERGGSVAEAPKLTLDAAMLLVDQRLADEGSAASCTRAEIESAFEYLTNPRIAAAVWSDPSRTSIVIVNPHGA